MCSAMFHRSLFDAKKQHVSCLAHVFNLAVQALLGKCSLGASAPKEVKGMVEDNDSQGNSQGNDQGGAGNDDDEVLVPLNIGQDPDAGAENADNDDAEQSDDDLFDDDSGPPADRGTSLALKEL